MRRSLFSFVLTLRQEKVSTKQPPPKHMQQISSLQYIRTIKTYESSVILTSCDDQTTSRVTGDSQSTELNQISTKIFPQESRTLQSESQNTETDVEEGNTKCMVCWERAPDCILLECGHCGLCVQCADQLWKQTRRCPLCRGSCAAVMQIVSCDASTVSAAFPLRLSRERSANLFVAE